VSWIFWIGIVLLIWIIFLAVFILFMSVVTKNRERHHGE